MWSFALPTVLGRYCPRTPNGWSTFTIRYLPFGKYLLKTSIAYFLQPYNYWPTLIQNLGLITIPQPDQSPGTRPPSAAAFSIRNTPAGICLSSQLQQTQQTEPEEHCSSFSISVHVFKVPHYWRTQALVIFSSVKWWKTIYFIQGSKV